MQAWTHKHRPWRRALRWFRHVAEGLALFLVIGVFWILPVDWASNLGGWVARQVGTRLSVNRRAIKHLQIAFPGMPESECRTIIAGMWDNLGRLVAEYPHLGTIANPKSGRVEVHNAERMVGVQQTGKPFIGFSGHMANFELMPVVAYKHDLNLTVVSRPVNSLVIQRILLYFRERPTGNWGKIPKGVDGARQALKLLKQGLNLGVLVDQRTSQGVALPLFGQPARTTLGIAKLAIDQDLPLVPVHIERLGGARFRISLEPPISHPQLGDRLEEAKAMMTEVNRTLERWIRHRPQDWLWLHRRWDRP
ncbi:lauroyl acyltransferase [Pelagibius litoralis]|uniref:Lauroyl acyltransferase n=1 Tax=Pelagibius litoralis TaxID=374515 RepID=A0A967F116_9PROT|nr:lauroyl acyltransferase [Pelagibius litoralis]NIA71193.1 lauroyl acyltransferase [Pelagibius litoralis]